MTRSPPCPTKPVSRTRQRRPVLSGMEPVRRVVPGVGVGLGVVDRPATSRPPRSRRLGRRRCGRVADLGASLPADARRRARRVPRRTARTVRRPCAAGAALLAAGLTAEQSTSWGSLVGDDRGAGLAGPRPRPRGAVALSSRRSTMRVESFSADVVPVGDDPSLVTDAAAPRLWRTSRRRVPTRASSPATTASTADALHRVASARSGGVEGAVGARA